MILTTNAPFFNDLCDIVRLYYGDIPIAPQGEGEPVIRHMTSPAAERVELWENGELTAFDESAGELPALSDGLLGVRLRKRAAKNALYQLLKKRTGIGSAWGSLTGIRPSRVLREGIEEMGDSAQAVRWLCDTFDVPLDKALRLERMLHVQAAVPAPLPDECDIYIGIPFCATRCSYCAFAAVDMRIGAPLMEGYLEALHAEITGSASIMRQNGYRPRAVYIGGGTPTTLSPTQMDSLLSLLRRLFPEAIEWTVEAGRPDTIDQQKLDILSRYGIGRISINPQTMNDSTLSAIGRAHTAADIESAYHLARRTGFACINMDIIAALPGEGVEHIENTLRRILSLRPENLTLHTLAIKRASQLRQSSASPLPPVEIAREMFDTALSAIENAGYQPYYLYRQKYMAGNLENIGACLPGHACLYNIDHMEEIAPILACGAGAISKWLFPRQRRIERAPNLRDIHSYTQRVAEMIARKRALIEG